MEEKPPTPYQSARVPREPKAVLRGHGESSGFRKICSQNLWISRPIPSQHGNPPNVPDQWENGEANWLKSIFHFSFEGEWRNGPINFGCIRFCNDHFLQPERQLNMKRQMDLEVICYVVEGTMNGEIGPGSILHLSCGLGL